MGENSSPCDMTNKVMTWWYRVQVAWNVAVPSHPIIPALTSDSSPNCRVASRFVIVMILDWNIDSLVYFNSRGKSLQKFRFRFSHVLTVYGPNSNGWKSTSATTICPYLQIKFYQSKKNDFLINFGNIVLLKRSNNQLY